MVVTRDQLHQLVWSKPMTKVAEQFGVSGSYLARVCESLRVRNRFTIQFEGRLPQL